MSTQAFETQLAYTHFALHRNLGGLSHDDSLRSPEPGGNCLLLFHEAYHVGQTGVLRRLLGRSGAIR